MAKYTTKTGTHFKNTKLSIVFKSIHYGFSCMLEHHNKSKLFKSVNIKPGLKKARKASQFSKR